MSRSRDNRKRNERLTHYRHRHVVCPRCGALGGGHYMPPSLGEPGRYVCAFVPLPEPRAMSNRADITEWLSDGLARATKRAKASSPPSPCATCGFPLWSPPGVRCTSRSSHDWPAGTSDYQPSAPNGENAGSAS